MRAPSSGTLLFGALFFLFAVLHLEGRGWLWSLNPVLAFRAALVTRPSLTVKLDLVALVTSILFFFAWRRRVAGGEGAPVEALSGGARDSVPAGPDG
jgi:hypothetical protein